MNALYLSLFLAFFSFVFPVDKAHADKPVSIDITINLKQTFLFNKNVFGVHGELLWSPVRYEDPVLARYYQGLGFTSIRLPGGTTANYYLSKTGHFGCMQNLPKDSKSASRIEKFNRALTKKNRRYTVDNFISFLQRVDTDVSLVANVLCDTPSATALWLKKFKDAGIHVNAVEMGNELYYPESQWMFPESKDYISTSKLHAAQVKKIYPNARIGLIASSFSFKSSMFPDLEKMQKNKRLARGLAFEKASSQADFADAFVIHLYSRLGTSRFDEMRDTVDIDEAYINAISHFDVRLPTTLAYLHDLSASRKVWVTEWGISFYGWLRPHEKDFESSFYNALFFANGLVQFSLSPQIERANYHNLTDFLPGNKKSKPSTVTGAVSFLKEIVQQSQKVGAVTLRGVKSYQSQHHKYKGESVELSAAFFSISGNQKLKGYLLIVNKFNTPYVINSLEMLSSIALKPVQISRLVAATKDGNKPGNGVTQQDISLNSGVIEIAPYSITRIKLAVADKK